MLSLHMDIDELDFDFLIDHFLPHIADQLRASGNPIGMLLSNGMSADMAKRIIHGLSQDQREVLAADLINGNQHRLITSFEQAASANGFPVRITSLEVNHKK